VLTLLGSAAGGFVWGWLLRPDPGSRPGVAARGLVLATLAAAFPASAAWLGGGTDAAAVSGVAVAAGLGAHASLRLALRRLASR
jgi:hypothetical protein